MVVGRELRVTRAADEASQVAGGGLVPLLDLPQPPVVKLHLLPQLGVLYHGVLLVILQAAHAVKSLQVHPALPSDTDTVQDEGSFQVDLEIIPGCNLQVNLDYG